MLSIKAFDSNQTEKSYRAEIPVGTHKTTIAYDHYLFQYLLYTSDLTKDCFFTLAKEGNDIQLTPLSKFGIYRHVEHETQVFTNDSFLFGHSFINFGAQGELSYVSLTDANYKSLGTFSIEEGREYTIGSNNSDINTNDEKAKPNHLKVSKRFGIIKLEKLNGSFFRRIMEKELLQYGTIYKASCRISIIFSNGVQTEIKPAHTNAYVRPVPGYTS